MIRWLKRYGMVVGLLVAALGGTGTLLAYAGSAVEYVDRYIEKGVDRKLDKVQFAMSQEVKQDIQALSRKLNGVQETVNEKAANDRALNERLKSLDQRQAEGQRSVEKQLTEGQASVQRQLDLIIKMIDK